MLLSTPMSNVSLTNGIPETILDPINPQVAEALEAASTADDPRAEIVNVVAQDPTNLFAWAQLGALGRDEIESYAAYRVGYHRGLDALRKAGWRGSGFVKWEHPSNRGFLSCLNGLQKCAQAISEADEAQRCADFLKQLDPETDYSKL